MVIEHVAGRNRGSIMLYALSTCQWCNKTKELLKELGVEFAYQYVDLLEGKERDDALDAVEKVNPQGAFPTLVIDGAKVILGFREKEIREALA